MHRRDAPQRQRFPASRRARPQSPEEAWQAIQGALGRLGPDLAAALIKEAPEFAMPCAPSSDAATARLAAVALAARANRATERHARRVFEEEMAESASEMAMPDLEEQEIRDADQRALAEVQVLVGDLKRMVRTAPKGP